MPLAQLIAAFQSNAIFQNGVLTDEGREDLKEEFTSGALKTVRVFVAAAPGYGHQASSVNILKRLIALGCPGPITVVYEVSDTHPNLPKLKVLLPGFDPENPDAPFTLNGVPVRFTAFTPGQKPDLPAGDLCVCGGSENQENLAAADRLDVRLYLQLQPFQWEMGTNTLWLRDESDPLILTEQKELGGESFVQRAFYMAEPDVPDTEWEKLTPTNALACARTVLEAVKDGTVDFMPVYGVGDKNDEIPTLPGTASGILFSLTAGIADAQTLDGSPITRPAVFGVLATVSETAWNTYKGLVKATAAAYVNATDWSKANKLPERVVFFDGTPEQLAGALAEAKPGQIVVVRMPGLPPDVFNLLYAKATLPPVFEGKGTANLMLNLGAPYLHMATSDDFVYPSAFLLPPNLPPEKRRDWAFVGTSAFELSRTVQETQTSLMFWPPVGRKDTPAAKIGGLIVRCLTPDVKPGLRDYFKRIGAFYHAEENDKLLMALLWSLQYLPQVQATSTRALALADAGPPDAGSPADAGQDDVSPLQAFYDALTGATQGGVLNLIPGAINRGVIFDFLTSVIGADSLTIGSGTTAVAIAFPAPYDAITVTGPTLSFGSGTLDSSIVFTLAVDGTSLTAALSLKGSSFSFDGAPWFEVNDTTIAVTVSNSGQRIQGAVSGAFTLGAKTLTVSFSYPAADSQLMLEGSFGDNPPNFNDVFQLLGGINFVSTLPSPLNNIDSLALKDIQLAYDYEASAVSALNVGLTTLANWEIFGKVILQKGASLTIVVASPTGSRAVSWIAAGTIQIGPGTVDLGITYPDINMSAQMAEDSKPIPLGDFLTFFLPPDVTLDLAADVTALSISAQPVATPVYQVSGALDTDWPVAVGGKTIFTLTGLSMDVQGTGAVATGSVSAQTRVFPDEPDIAFELSVTAAYLGKGAWSFSGELSDGTIKVVDILRQYLPDGWIPDPAPDIDITVFNAKIESSGTSGVRNSYEVGGTVKVWDVPFADSISFESTVQGKFGYRAADAGTRLGVPRLRTSPAAFPILAEDGRGVVLATAAEDGPAKDGHYGEVVALIDWANIELALSFNFEPGVQKYQITWGIFTGTLTQKEVEGAPHWIADVGFTESTTLGGIIETFISWATGSRFGLSAPWSVLNNIPLSNFSLEFDITAGTVAFRVDIGPIELGFARLDAIRVRYDNDKANPSDNGVLVEIEGSFRWQDDPDTPLGWDATKPETTPAPPGNGNKYIDLRLLALGQHVTAACFPTANTVQKAIECMSTLPEPTAGTIPPITFDANSNWLIGTDMGVLRIDDGDDKGNYVVTLQVVFNDPSLYGLRLALAGDAAKILKGLDFQIMYRKISENLGVYQAEIALPATMRKFQAGAFTVTLPVFAIQVYTNGDFLIDVGFPWNEDFSRSFTVEAMVPPGIPLLGSGGLYFGKLSSATTDKVPAVTDGTFNPVIVFGFGAQLGLGKSIEAGILSAGFSLTVFGIIEGVLAKWNPYLPSNTGNSPPDQLQGQYYFALSGTMGIIGVLYGSVNFAVVKAEVNIEIKLYAQIVFASYQDIPLSVVASVKVSARVTIKLGFFKIHLSFSFSARIKETFVITTAHDAPWTLAPPASRAANARLARPTWTRLKDSQERRLALRTATLAPAWDQLLKPATALPLTGYCATGLTVAGDGAATAAQQVPCYVLSMFIDSMPTADQDSESSALKAAGDGADTPFEALSKLVAKWAVAAIQTAPCTPDKAGALIVTEDQLQFLLDYLSDPNNPTPLPRAAVDAFLHDQVAFAVQATDTAGEAHATFFPMPVALALNIPDYGSWQGYGYRFTDYNSLSATYLEDLRVYFDQLAVQVQQDSRRNPAARMTAGEDDTSIADFLFADYFLLIMRQMIQAMSDGLRDFKYPIQPGDTGNGVVAWTNATGNLSGDDAFSLADLFVANGDHALAAGKRLTVGGAPHAVQPGETFTTIAAQAAYGGAFDAAALATLNQDAAGLFLPDASFTYGGAVIALSGASSLSTIAAGLGVTLAALLAGSDLLTKAGLLAPLAVLRVPPFPYATAAGDTLTEVAGRLGVTVQDLAEQDGGFDNGTVADLFSTAADANLDLAHLPAFQVDALLREAQRSLAIQHLSGMASRYYFSGLRLPTAGITPKARGMWVTDTGGTLTLPADAGLFALSGQQFPLPDIAEPDPFVINLDGFAGLGWMSVPGGGDRFTISVTGNSTDNKAIQALKAYATAKPLALAASGLDAGPMVGRAAASYPLSSSTLWQNTAGIALPYGDPAQTPTAVNLWALPQAMAALPDPARRAIDPRFALSVERYDEASGTTRSTPVTDYGWASVAAFTVKRVSEQSVAAPASLNTYEIVGAGGQDALVLERLVETLGSRDEALFGLSLAYAAGGAAGGAGVQTDPPGTLTIGVAQVNLSTVTRPPAAGAFRAAAEEAGTGPFPTLLNTPTEFVRLVWEASITRSGGFFLYYADTASGAGLPDRIFNDKGEAVLSLIVLHAKPAASDAQNRLSDCMNAVVIGDKVDLTGASIVATSAGVAHQVAVDAASTLAGLAYRYYANLADVATAAAALPLASGARLTVDEGVYMVSPLATAPGGDPAAIAAHFGTTLAALQAANPRVASWASPLPAYTALRLPALAVTVGTSPGGATLAAVAAYYGVSLTGLAAGNAGTAGLFQPGSVSIVGGPTVLSSKATPGVQAIAAARPVPPPVPDDPSADGYAEDFLATTFSLLGYKVAANQDFQASNLGLPAGPQAPAGDGSDKIQVPARVEDLEVWDYALSVPYTQLSTLPGGNTGVSLAAGQSPYRGNGTLLQLDFAWRDLYGNLIVTTLDQPPPGSTGPFNRSPTLVGYTDELIALSRWPSVSAGWRVGKDDGGAPSVQLLLSFGPSPFLSKQEDPTNGTDAWQDNATRALPTVQALIYQLTDPNGVAFSLDTSLTAAPLPLGAGPSQGLLAWVQAIFSFLQDRAAGGKTVPAPPASPTPALAASLDPARVTAEQIFPLTLSFAIERTGGVFEGECGTLPGVRRAVTLVAPAADGDGSGSLLAFAAGLREALSSAGVYTLNVATGVDRAAPSAAESPAAVWAVRLGAAAGQGIGYSLRKADGPIVLAPRPVSNVLISRPGVPIYDYVSGTGIDWQTPSRRIDFKDIDVDGWAGQLFSAIDEVLTPAFTSALLVVDNRTATPAPSGEGYLGALLALKEALAGIVAQLMIPVYADQKALGPGQLEAAQETFRQQLLVALGNAYAVHAAVEFLADVTADVTEGPEATQPPNLYGAVAAHAGSTVSFTASKLVLATTATGSPAPLVTLVTAPGVVKDDSGAVREVLDVTNAVYDGSAIEHQIGDVPGIDGYKASSWLSFVETAAAATLDSALGDFQVPLVLRSFPSTPAMTDHTGTASDPATTELDRILEWSYRFTYSLDYHYPQDRIYATVIFNVADSALRAQAELADAFPALAEFVTVFPDVRKDLVDKLARVDAKTADAALIADATAAIQSFNAMVDGVVTQARGGGLRVSAPNSRVVGTAVEPYSFTVEESAETVDAVEALVVTILGAPPAGIGSPSVTIDSYTTKPLKAAPGTYSFYFVGDDGKPLEAAKGQAIGPRTVVLPEMQVLQRQDAWSSVHLTRNEELGGKAIAAPFIYQTPEVRFAAPLRPVLRSSQPVDVATLGSPDGTPQRRPLTDHLTALFAALFKSFAGGEVTIQTQVSYAYAVNPALSPLSLPVLMLPPLSVSVDGGTEPTLASLTADLSGAITQWFDAHQPVAAAGTLTFELTIMSNLTKTPMPLVDLDDVFLAIAYVEPPLKTT